jgi:putative transcription antitermination factor YqgF
MSLMGIDYGGKRIGIATSASGVLATPHSVIENGGDAVDRIARIGEELEADIYVVGIARRSRTTAGEQKFHDFAESLRQRTCKTVVLWDETLSTVEAAARLRDSGRKGRDQTDIDMYAAAIILQAYLDEQGRRAS